MVHCRQAEVRISKLGGRMSLLVADRRLLTPTDRGIALRIWSRLVLDVLIRFERALDSVPLRVTIVCVCVYKVTRVRRVESALARPST